MSPWQFWRVILFQIFLIWFFDQADSQYEPDSRTETILPPEIYSLHIVSDIRYRYAHTSVVSRVANPANVSQEVHFHLVLPESAFITGFVMTIKEKDYEAYVKEKEEAKRKYNAAVNAGQTAAHVAYSARDSNKFMVSVNVEPMEKVTFNLTYEDFLKRTNGSYMHIINISPGQIVKDLKVIVNIEDAFPITDVRVPNLRTSNEIKENEERNKLAETKKSTDSKKVQIKWSPLEDEQKKMGTQEVQGQFVVYYEVDRTSKQQVLINDGYFVHFYAADNLKPLSKHVVFVLDFSGSMIGRKIAQLKKAMNTILSHMSKEDYFSIVLFSSISNAWAPDKRFEEHGGAELSLDYVIPASKQNIGRAKKFVHSIKEEGGTNIMAGLRDGIELARIGSRSLRSSPHKPQPILIFLTDGEPNIEVHDTKTITKKIIKLNTLRVPIFSLAFGSGADINFLRNLSLTNSGFARTIYEDSDAALQLNNFFKSVSSPLLQNVTFDYLPGQVEAVAKKDFKLLFRGTELVVVGKALSNTLAGKLKGNSKRGVIEYPIKNFILIDHLTQLPTEAQSKKEPSHLERLWAYETIKNLLDESKAHGSETAKKQALDLALKYSFVTPVTSLVVVKPNETKSVDATASEPQAAYPSLRPVTRVSKFPLVKRVQASVMDFSCSTCSILDPRLPQLHYRPRVHSSSFPAIRPFTRSARPFNISVVTWLTVTDDKDFVKPPDYVSTDVISLYPADIPKIKCTKPNNSTKFCKHFVDCILPKFLKDPANFMPFKCHIPPNFVGVCCPY